MVYRYIANQSNGQHKLYYFYLSNKKSSKVCNHVECSKVSLGQARDFFGMTDTLFRGLKSHIYTGILFLKLSC